jgi:hypothetical protein
MVGWRTLSCAIINSGRPESELALALPVGGSARPWFASNSNKPGGPARAYVHARARRPHGSAAAMCPVYRILFDFFFCEQRPL